MEKLANLFGKRIAPPKKARRTERGDAFDVILSMVNPDRIAKKYPPLTHKRLGFLLTGIPTRDLYALVSKMRDAERRGVAAGAVFWMEVRPKEN